MLTVYLIFLIKVILEIDYCNKKIMLYLYQRIAFVKTKLNDRCGN